MTGPTHRRYDRSFRYLGRFDREGNLVEPPDAEKAAPAECSACGCRHFIRAGEHRICRNCGRTMSRGAETTDEAERPAGKDDGS